MLVRTPVEYQQKNSIFSVLSVKVNTKKGEFKTTTEIKVEKILTFSKINCNSNQFSYPKGPEGNPQNTGNT